MHYTTYSSAAILDLTNYQEDLLDSFRWGADMLHDLTTDVWDYSFGFVRVGIAAELVRSRNLWNQSTLYLDWRDYCVKALGKTAWSINRTIDAAKVVMRLIEFGHTTLPTCEAQCRPLVSKMRNMCEGLHDAWENVLGEISAERITANQIDAIVNPGKGEGPERIAKGTMQRLTKLAKERGISIDDLLDDLLMQVEGSSPADERPSQPNKDVSSADFEDIMADLDLKFAIETIDKPPIKPNPKPRSSADRSPNLVTAFDDLMHDLVGQFIPSPVGGNRKKISIQV